MVETLFVSIGRIEAQEKLRGLDLVVLHRELKRTYSGYRNEGVDIQQLRLGFEYVGSLCWKGVAKFYAAVNGFLLLRFS